LMSARYIIIDGYDMIYMMILLLDIVMINIVINTQFNR
jgi:hypothetical protein